MRVCEWDGPVLKHLAGEQVGCQWCGPHHERDAINPYHPQYYHSPRRRLCLPTHQHMLGSLPLAVDPAIGPPGTPTHLMHLPATTVRGKALETKPLYVLGTPAAAPHPGCCYIIDAASQTRHPVCLHPTPHLGLGHVQLLLNGLQLPPLHLQLKCLRSGQGRGGVLSHEYEQKICDSGSPSPLPSAPCVRMCRPGHSACGSCPAGGRSQRGPAGCGVPHAGMVRHGWNWVTALLPHRLLATSTCSHCTCTTQSQSKLHMAAMRQVTCMHLGVEG